MKHVHRPPTRITHVPRTAPCSHVQRHVPRIMNQHLSDSKEAEGMRRIRCKYYALWGDIFKT